MLVMALFAWIQTNAFGGIDCKFVGRTDDKAQLDVEKLDDVDTLKKCMEISGKSEWMQATLVFMLRGYEYHLLNGKILGVTRSRP